MISYTGREPVFLLSFIASASYRSESFTILSPSPLLYLDTCNDNGEEITGLIARKCLLISLGSDVIGNQQETW